MAYKYSVNRGSIFSTPGAEGSRFAAGIMTVAASCKQHGRNTTEYIARACAARLHGHPAPSLPPVYAEILAQVAWTGRKHPESIQRV